MLPRISHNPFGLVCTDHTGSPDMYWMFQKQVFSFLILVDLLSAVLQLLNTDVDDYDRVFFLASLHLVCKFLNY